METLQEYQVDLHWKEEQGANISSILFKDHIDSPLHSCLTILTDEIWSAEHLFIGSLVSSYTAAFLKSVHNKDIRYKNFKSSARATVVFSDKYAGITDIVIRPIITIIEKKQINKTLKIFSLCKKHCLVLNAINTRVHIFPSVVVEK